MTSYIMQSDEISIGAICPLPIEVAAMIQMLDKRYRLGCAEGMDGCLPRSQEKVVCSFVLSS